MREQEGRSREETNREERTRSRRRLATTIRDHGICQEMRSQRDIRRPAKHPDEQIRRTNEEGKEGRKGLDVRGSQHANERTKKTRDEREEGGRDEERWREGEQGRILEMETNESMLRWEKIWTLEA